MLWAATSRCVTQVQALLGQSRRGWVSVAHAAACRSKPCLCPSPIAMFLSTVAPKSSQKSRLSILASFLLARRNVSHQKATTPSSPSECPMHTCGMTPTAFDRTHEALVLDPAAFEVCIQLEARRTAARPCPNWQTGRLARQTRRSAPVCVPRYLSLLRYVLLVCLGLSGAAAAWARQLPK